VRDGKRHTAAGNSGRNGSVIASTTGIVGIVG
jgi:hypothetical protein